ncbi:MAG: response regulator [Chitinispirillaceae bacterium]
MPRQHVMIVEDEQEILELLIHNLSKEGYQVSGATSGEDALPKIRSTKPELILLDLLLPGMNGLDLCRTVKRDSSTQDIPIIMVTAKGEENDILTGLKLGADDYIVKPFSPRILIARMRAVLRRKNRTDMDNQAPIEINEITLNPGRHEVTAGGEKIDLTYTEFKILMFLASHPGWVFSRFQIVEAVRGDNYPVTDRAVDVVIVGLRRKLGPYGNCIETVRGVGYKMREQ